MEILPDINVMAVVCVVFFATMFCLNKFVFVPLISYMDQRQSKIDDDLKSVGNYEEELRKIELEIENIMKNAKAEARNIIETETAKAKEKASNKIKNITLENKEKFDSFIKDLNGQRDQMKEDLRNHLGGAQSSILSKMKNI